MAHRMLPVATAVALAALGSGASADGGRSSTFSTNLTGYQETPVTINSSGSGEFAAKIVNDGNEIQYVLRYRDLSTNVTQSHIHFGRPALTGGIVLFLCTNGTPPAGVPTPPACPQAPVGGGTQTVTGTLTAANILVPNITTAPLPTQGIDPGAMGFAEVVKAIRNGAAYANVHTSKVPSGEIRGALGKPQDGDEDDDD